MGTNGVGGSSCHFPQFLVLVVISFPADGSSGQRGGSWGARLGSKSLL